MSEHTESLKVWRCSYCGAMERSTGRWRRSPEFKGGEPTPQHWHWENEGPREFVPAEEVEVIPAAEAERRAEAAETELQGLREGLQELADWRDAEASMLPGYEATAKTPDSAAWHQGARAALGRVGEKVQALLDTYSVDEGSAS